MYRLWAYVIYVLDFLGNFMGSNNLNVHQLIGNPATEQGTRANWSVGATSTSLGSWAHQLSPFGNSDWNQNYGGQNYRGNVERTGLYYFNGNNWAQSSGMPREIARLAMTQLGSQALVQRMITPGDPLAKSMVLEGVFGSLFEVMCDFHGHYVFRKLVESCNHSRLRLIVAKITLNSEPLINVSVCNYGYPSNPYSLTLKKTVCFGEIYLRFMLHSCEGLVA